MAKKQEEPKKKSLFAEYEEACQEARAELEKLPPEEQKKRIEGQKRLQKKWDNQPWY